jgi:hypothetical protein
VFSSFFHFHYISLLMVISGLRILHHHHDNMRLETDMLFECSECIYLVLSRIYLGLGRLAVQRSVITTFSADNAYI